MTQEQTQQLSTKTEAQVPKKPKTGRAISIIALFIAILATVGTFYLCWQLQMTQQTMHQQKAQFEKASALLTQQQNALSALQKQSQELIEKSQQADSTTILPRINHLLKLAAFYLTFENDAGSAKQLLQIADQEITADQNPVFLPLHKALMEDISALNAATLDLSDIVGRIGLLSEQIEKLPQLPVSGSVTDAATPSVAPQKIQPQTALEHLKVFAASAWHALANMVVITTDNQDAPLLLTSQQRAYLTTNIQSQLNLAQWAAIHRNASVYTQSLNQVSNWLNHYFPTDDPQVAEMLNAIKDLKAIVVNPEVPQISNSLTILKQSHL